MVITRKDKIVKLLTTLLVAALALLFISPLLWMVSTSLKRNSEVFAQPFHWIPEDPSLSNYAEVWFEEGVNMLHAYRNSFIIVFFSVTGSLIIASLAAYAFAKINFKGKNAIFMLFLSSMMIPSQTTLVPRFMLFKTMGLYNSLWAIILPGLFSATAIFMLRQFYMGLPNDLMEAAKIDGAGHFRIFAQIMLPLTKAALISLMILSFISNWNEYLSPLIFITKKELYPVSLTIRWWMLEDASDYAKVMAASTSAIVPVVILFASCQKYFVEGIATSGVKG